MSHLFAILIAFVFALPAVRAGDAVAKAVFGRVDVPKEEELVSSFSVFTTLMVARNQCDKLPVAFFQSLPVYPSSVLRASVVGEATVSFVISEQGVVGDIKVERATVEEFGAASVGAVVQWRFFPAEKRRIDVPVRAKATFTFSMFDEDGG